MRELRLRLKLLISDKVAVLCYIASAVVMLTVLGGLRISAEERSAVPIGLVCLDDSPEAERLCERMRDNEAFYCIDGTADELLRLMQEGYVNSVFLIPEDYGRRVERGETDELISITSVKDDRISVLAADITAGCMMHDICVSKAFKKYGKLEDAIYDREAFTERIKELEADPEFTYSFEMIYKDNGYGKADPQTITNSVIYRQAIACLLALLLSVLAFCSCNGISQERGTGISTRRRLIPASYIAAALREIAAIFIFLIPACVLSSVMAGDTKDFWSILKLFALNASFILVFVVFYYLCARIARSIFAYQLLGTASVMILGATGFINILTSLLGSELFRMTPYAVFVRAITDLI